jgi:methylene-fatty-acyl-phospholipid synthase
MAVTALAVAMVLLSLERLFYLWVWNRPQQFAAWCDEIDPIDALEIAMIGFKVMQLAVFISWCVPFAGSGLRTNEAAAPVAGILLIGVGQSLNYAVFHRLGRVGVFYGNRFGRPTIWCTRFPFSVLRHPQYLGASLSIWGFFLLFRFPHDDWFVLPAVETIYYAAGAYLEQ